MDLSDQVESQGKLPEVPSSNLGFKKPNNFLVVVLSSSGHILRYISNSMERSPS